MKSTDFRFFTKYRTGYWYNNVTPILSSFKNYGSFDARTLSSCPGTRYLLFKVFFSKALHSRVTCQHLLRDRNVLKQYNAMVRFLCDCSPVTKLLMVQWNNIISHAWTLIDNSIANKQQYMNHPVNIGHKAQKYNVFLMKLKTEILLKNWHLWLETW